MSFSRARSFGRPERARIVAHTCNSLSDIITSVAVEAMTLSWETQDRKEDKTAAFWPVNVIVDVRLSREIAASLSI